MEIKLELESILLPGIEDKRPFIIAGPCSAETEDQVLNTARELAANGIKVFRAGIWKPRTRPGSFEGIGSAGLPWLQRVKKETGMYTAVEVATAQHVYEAIKYGIDMLWIGARTTANPFAVQEVADALRGTDMPILVKNPVNPDLELWIGALERLNRAGIKRLAAIHRGFSVYQKIKYRNDPQWQLAIELHRRLPDMPIINDPSHISGDSELILELAQQAMDLNFQGIIVESHECPARAWSDAKQQVTPAHLKMILDKLVIRDATIGDKPRTELDELRQKIDILDKQMLEILATRMKISENIARYKYDNGITILQSRRYDEILKNRCALGEQNHLESDFVVKIFEAIHEESVSRQNAVMSELQKETKK